MATNPYTVLGLTPGIVSKHNDAELTSLISAAYRALSRLHHPDVSGSSAFFKEINDANELLKEQESRTYWKQQLLRPRKDQIQILQAEAQDAERRTRTAYEQLVSFLAAFYCLSPGNVFHPQPHVLLMSDVMKVSLEANNIHQTYGESRSPASTYQWMNFHANTIGHRLFDLVIGTDGSLQKIPIAKQAVPYEEHYNWPPKWHGIGQVNPGRKGEPFCLVRQGEGESIRNTFLVGCMEQVSTQEATLQPLMAGFDTSTAYALATDGYPLEYFEPYLPFLKPELEVSGYLIGMKFKENEPRFVILGRINAIAPNDGTYSFEQSHQPSLIE